MCQGLRAGVLGGAWLCVHVDAASPTLSAMWRAWRESAATVLYRLQGRM